MARGIALGQSGSPIGRYEPSSSKQPGSVQSTNVTRRTHWKLQALEAHLISQDDLTPRSSG